MPDKIIRVLLVEDNATDALLARDEMAHALHATFVVEQAQRLRTALALLTEKTFDVILLDLSLPDSEGLATFSGLQAAAPGVPVVVLSHRADEQLALQAVQAGAQDYLVKGQVEGMLVRAIRHAIERAHADRALRRSEADLKEAQRIAHIGSWSWDPVSDELTWSDEMFRIFAIAPDAFTALHADVVASVIHAEDRAAVEAARYNAFANTTQAPLEYRVIRPDGSQRIVLDEIGGSLRNAQGTLIELHGIARDITDSRHASQQLLASNERLQALARRMESIREEQSAFIAREIHDVLAQELTLVKIDLVWLARNLAEPVAEPMRLRLLSRVASATTQTDVAIDAVQRIATDLRPVILDSLGLFAAVEWHVEKFAERSGLTWQVVVPDSGPLPDRDRAIVLFRILQESLVNVARHALANHVDVQLEALPGLLILSVQDNGVGIAPEQIASAYSVGLIGMSERAQVFGGSVTFRCEPGEGTRVIVRLPLEDAP